MSDILIKGMEMPESCITGSIPNYEYCPFFTKCDKATGKESRPEDCPLVELPDSSWHKGTPTEEGWYLITDGRDNYDVTHWLIFSVEDEEDEEGEWDSTWLDKIIAYQKIEPYKEG